jgi:Putative zinc-finger
MTHYQPIMDRHHQENWELLPWYVNGTLAGQELARVESHLAVCPACKEEVVRWRHIAVATRLADESVPPPATAGWARMMARIDAIEANEQQAYNGRSTLWQQLRSVAALFQQTPRLMRVALAFEGALTLLLAGVIVWQAQSTPRFYKTLSSPAVLSQHVGHIRLVFTEDITEKELRELLTSVRATIIKGPSQVGAYTVEVPLEDNVPAALQTLLGALRAHHHVRLAEPVATP